jgi:hypothetical protein
VTWWHVKRLIRRPLEAVLFILVLHSWWLKRVNSAKYGAIIMMDEDSATDTIAFVKKALELIAKDAPIIDGRLQKYIKTINIGDKPSRAKIFPLIGYIWLDAGFLRHYATFRTGHVYLAGVLVHEVTHAVIERRVTAPPMLRVERICNSCARRFVRKYSAEYPKLFPHIPRLMTFREQSDAVTRYRKAVLKK